jgi:photosystem II stability/assembly factor-like uncharacterized protein
VSKFFTRLVVIFFLAGALTRHQAQDHWLKANSPTTKSLTAVFFLDSLTGWAAGDSGTIIHTTNGGQSWIFQDSNLESDIIDIYFWNDNVGWALAWNSSTLPFGTIILRTTNRGNDWSGEQYSEENIFMFDIEFLDSLNGWMGGSQGRIVSTTNGGTNWTPSVTSGLCSGTNVLDLGLLSSEYAFACGGYFDLAGVVWRKMTSQHQANTGGQWFSQCVSAEPIQQLYFLDSLNIVGVGGDFEFGTGIIKTTNGGLNWKYTSLSVFGIALALSFRTASEGWAPLGFAEKFIYTLDSGDTWNETATPENSAILDLTFTDSSHGYAVGYEGVILKYKPSTVDVKIIQTPDLPYSNRLFQNFPNPFNPTTSIAFSISNSANVILKVYDILGEEIAILVNENKPAGTHRVAFNAQDLPSGVYYYELISKASAHSDRDFHQIRKMVFVK